MHAGQTAEGGPIEDLLTSPMHSCTQRLRTARGELGGRQIADV
jgi:ABC-type glutathione transport system ATPase component